MIMSRTGRRSGILALRPPVAGHAFAVGQPVRLKSTVGTDASSTARFRVLATMPARDGSLQYRIRDERETHDRVATEDLLEAVPAPAGGDRLAWTEQETSRGQGPETQRPEFREPAEVKAPPTAEPALGSAVGLATSLSTPKQ